MKDVVFLDQDFSSIWSNDGQMKKHPFIYYGWIIVAVGIVSYALGFGMGMTSPPIAAATTDIFQGPKAGAIIGFVWFNFALGGLIGPWLGGWVFEFTRSYKSAFFMAIVICALGCGGMWWAAPRKIRQVPGRVTSKKV